MVKYEYFTKKLVQSRYGLGIIGQVLKNDTKLFKNGFKIFQYNNVLNFVFVYDSVVINIISIIGFTKLTELFILLPSSQ